MRNDHDNAIELLGAVQQAVINATADNARVAKARLAATLRAACAGGQKRYRTYRTMPSPKATSCWTWHGLPKLPILCSSSPTAGDLQSLWIGLSTRWV